MWYYFQIPKIFLKYVVNKTTDISTYSRIKLFQSSNTIKYDLLDYILIINSIYSKPRGYY